jgi:hypothetical protein
LQAKRNAVTEVWVAQREFDNISKDIMADDVTSAKFKQDQLLFQAALRVLNDKKEAFEHAKVNVERTELYARKLEEKMRQDNEDQKQLAATERLAAEANAERVKTNEEATKAADQDKSWETVKTERPDDIHNGPDKQKLDDWLTKSYSNCWAVPSVMPKGDI